MKFLTAIALSAVLFTGCIGNPPPNLSPKAQQAYFQTQIIKDLDILRDAVVEANAVSPTLVSTKNTALVVRFHESALRIVAAANQGWKIELITSLTELHKNLTPNEQTIVGVYFELVINALQVTF